MVNGIVNIYKEKGYTSFDVVARLRGIFHQKKIGHTGTLDPDAEGVLPVCLGNATRVCELLTDRDKEYEAVLLLGRETDTQDISGKLLCEAEVCVSGEAVADCILGFIGSYEQVPPMYSALKVNGQKLCDLARKGITVERKPRTVTIHDIRLLEIALPRVRMRISCSKGTYIRTLCHDIGRKLGCYGCMESLLRTKAAGFCLEDAIRLDELSACIREASAGTEPADWNRRLFSEWVQPVDMVFGDYPKAVASNQAKKAIVNGNRISVDNLSEPFSGDEQSLLRLYDEEEQFIGIYSFLEESRELKPIRLFLE